MTFGDDRLPERFWAKVSVQMDGCWVWTGALNQCGYGNFKHPFSKLAHRVSYRMLRGSIDAGLVLDHLCRVRSCVNPEHLRAVTHADNMLAPGSQWPAAIHATKTKCPRGHRLDPPNLVASNFRSGRRACLACSRALGKARREEAAGRPVDVQSLSDAYYSALSLVVAS